MILGGGRTAVSSRAPEVEWRAAPPGRPSAHSGSGRSPGRRDPRHSHGGSRASTLGDHCRLGDHRRDGIVRVRKDRAPDLGVARDALHAARTLLAPDHLVDSTRCGCCPSPGGTLVIKLQATYCKPLFKSSLQGQPYLNVTSCEPRRWTNPFVSCLLQCLKNSNGREVRENDIAVGIAERESSTMIAPPVAGVARSREGDRPRAEDAPAISIVIPTRHEAATIGALLYRTL